MPKMVFFGDLLKIWSLRSNNVTRQVNFNMTKIGGKCQNWKIQCGILSNFQTMWTRKISRPCGVNLEDLPPDHILTRFMRGGFSTLFFRKTCFFKRHEIFSRFLIRPVYCFKSIKCLSKIFCFDFFAIRLPVSILRLRESILRTLR